MPKNSSEIELYLIRHAETVMNVSSHLVGGRSNKTPLTPMTPKGVEEAKQLGRAMLARQILPAKVYTSPALRTRETARYSLLEMGLDIEPLIQDEIQELSQGPWETRLRAEVYTENVLSEIAKLGKDFKLEGGESMNDVSWRMYDWVSKTFSARSGSEKPQRYFVYTHGGSIKYLASHILNWSQPQTYETPINNTSVNLFTQSDGLWRVNYLNKDPQEL